MDPRSSPLYTFLCVYRYGSQMKAAAQLHLTQPGVSQHIKVLENRFGKILFKRVGRQLIATAAAHQLAEKISKPIDTLENVWNSLKTNPTVNTVTLGSDSDFFSTIVAQHVQELTQLGIHCNVILQENNLDHALLHKEIDIAQFNGPVHQPGIEIEKFFTQEFILIGHPKWHKMIPLGCTRKKLLSILKVLPWVVYGDNLLFIKDYFLTIFEEPFEGNILLTVPNIFSILKATLGGSGITVLPSYLCQEAIASHKLTILHQPKKAVLQDFYLGWKEGALTTTHINTTKLFLQRIAQRYLPNRGVVPLGPSNVTDVYKA